MRPDIDAIEQRAKAATPPPWGYDFQEPTPPTRPKFVLRGPVVGGRSVHAEPWLGDLNADGHATTVTDTIWPDVEVKMRVERANVEFITRARADVPSLITYVRALEEAVREGDLSRARQIIHGGPSR